jgi:hypothetical protein
MVRMAARDATVNEDELVEDIALARAETHG